MSQVYIVHEGSKSTPMNRIRCANEDVELQQLLENNPQLMPGDQIRPDDPRRWMLIKREMPVPDPSTGDNRWSIDHFFVDQSGMPTFVECKRFLDTRSRREVVGQMLDYAANGQYYWDKNLMRDYAEGMAKEKGQKLEDLLHQLEPDVNSIDEFFETIENNLREGQVRLVFFMEEAPHELRSIVDFLNKQMERSEVLIIEAKQFESNGMRVVAPQLFGYTEEARRVKRTVTVSSSGQKRQWTEEMFLSHVRSEHQPGEVQAFEKVLQYAKSDQFSIKWGTGKQDGSLSIIGSGSLSKSLFSFYTSGWFVIPFGSINGTEHLEGLRDDLAEMVVNVLGVSLPEDYRNKYPNIRLSVWAPKVDELIDQISILLQKYQRNNLQT